MHRPKPVARCDVGEVAAEEIAVCREIMRCTTTTCDMLAPSRYAEDGLLRFSIDTANEHSVLCPQGRRIRAYSLIEREWSKSRTLVPVHSGDQRLSVVSVAAIWKRTARLTIFAMRPSASLCV